MTSLHTWSDLSWHALFNGFYLDDATENTTLNICCHSTQFFGIQSVHPVALVQTELWGNEASLGYFYQCDQPASVSEHRTTIFDLFWPHWESLLIRWLGDCSRCPSLTWVYGYGF